MTRPRPARTAVAQSAHARAMEVRLDLARAIRAARRDMGLTARQLAHAAGVGMSTVMEIEAASRDPGIEVVARIAAALGGQLRAWFEPGIGATIHDRHQAAMVGVLVASLHPSWNATLEVAVRDPVRGAIDAVLERDLSTPVVAMEAESGLPRIEQQVRWSTAKSEALSRERGLIGLAASVSRLLLLRSTQATRAVAATYGDVLRAAYPARSVDALEGVRGTAPWPGAAIVWCGGSGASMRLLDGPPGGVDVGR